MPQPPAPATDGSAAPARSTTNTSLVWLFGVFLASLLLVVGLKVFFDRLYDELGEKSANERARLFVGEEIVRGIHAIEKDLYRMAATTHAGAVVRIRQQIDRQIAKLEHDLAVLKEGGSVRREVLLNIEGRDEMVREVRYLPEPGQQAYVLELIEILPLLDQITGQTDEMQGLLARRWQARADQDRQGFFAVEQEIANFLKHVPPFFSRLDENANRLFFDSSARLRSLELELDAQRSRFKLIEMMLVALVVLVASLAAVLVMRRIREANRRLGLALDHMQQAKEEAERASRAKSEFVSRMSHELRTPLNAILGFAQLLESEPLEPSQQSYVGLINRSGQHLMDLINQVLDHAKIEAGRLSLEHIAFDFRQAVDEVAAIVAERAGSKGLRFAARIADDLPHRVMGDPTRLRQVLINLLTNAVKFTEQGSVELRVAPDGDRIFFSIRDTGIGMDERARARLFQPFGQADDSITRKYGGTGLGLMISQELVQAMGGQIEVDSAPGAGSCFWFALPLSEAAAGEDTAKPAAPGAAAPLPALVGGRVLLVDDNQVNQKLGSAMLDRLGLPHDLAGNGIECLQRLAAGRYALVLMDMEMPEMDGLSATRQIRADEATAGNGHLPIIAMTANAMHEDQRRCLAAGMDGYVAKPINLSLLEQEIRRVATGGEAPHGPEATAEAPVFDRTRALAMVDDPELFAELADMFIKDVGTYLEDAGEALSAGDWGRLSRGVHTLKGLFATFAAPRCEQLARRLEAAAAGQDAAACAALAPALRHETEALLAELRAHIAGR
jgi:signal transduction histidine kinase/DNA-binding NarL/FixJ family response regulator